MKYFPENKIYTKHIYHTEKSRKSLFNEQKNNLKLKLCHFHSKWL